ncbi:60S acidic ribosomal protein P0-like [Asparagus officinalis]|uniref:60S acidic ribosomal protein P0-like n=1 Tax=Asparagus officinalis TaxID=4686 RepID=UPI00098DE953|nr:60S acidic ribosomal protein P0-like [Asparagus officinalis]
MTKSREETDNSTVESIGWVQADYNQIKPLPCGLAILPVYANGSVLSPELLNLTDKFANGISMVASLPFTLSYPTLAAAIHMFVNAYKNVLAVAVISVVSTENATFLASKERGKKDEPGGELDDDLGFSLFDYIRCYQDSKAILFGSRKQDFSIPTTRFTMSSNQTK